MFVCFLVGFVFFCFFLKCLVEWIFFVFCLFVKVVLVSFTLMGVAFFIVLWCCLYVLPSLFCICSRGFALFWVSFQKSFIVLRLFEHFNIDVSCSYIIIWIIELQDNNSSRNTCFPIFTCRDKGYVLWVFYCGGFKYFEIVLMCDDWVWVFVVARWIWLFVWGVLLGFL